MNHTYPEIDEMITYIHKHIDEPLPLSRLAHHASYSPFHFSRIFKQKTGLSPHYYVASLKMQKAKDLLLNTDLTVRDIGMEIGQQSVGTFTTRFTERVGMTPSQFRRSPMQVGTYLQSLKKMANWTERPVMEIQGNKVEGMIEAETPFHGVILVGLFTKPIPEGLPRYGTLLSSIGDFTFTNVHPGVYYLMATAVSWEMKINEILVPQQTLRAKAEQPVIVGSEMVPSQQRLLLRGPRLDDPPILISLPLLIRNFLNRS